MAIAIVNSISARQAVLADAVTSAAFATLLIAGSGLVAPMTGLPAGFVFWLGIALLPWRALALIGQGRRPPCKSIRR